MSAIADTGQAGSGSRFGSSPNEAPRPAEPLAVSDGKASEKTISCTSCRKRKLKCDRVKPACGTCSRLRHDCEYPERRRNMGSKRRNMKELEARLAEVETRLVAETKAVAAAGANSTTTAHASTSIEADWNTLGMDLNMEMALEIDMDINTDLNNPTMLNPGYDMPSTGYNIPYAEPLAENNQNYPQELLELGLEEPLPPQEMIDDLHRIYFDKIHPIMPMIHKGRYFASLVKAPKSRPPICLRYAMWSMACSVSDQYLCLEDLMYERARHYLQVAEMKAHGELFVTVYHTQAWSIIAMFEAKKAYFSRSWMSTGRATRLGQMLGLHQLDATGSAAKQVLLPPRDWTELEERRRTFWFVFYGDRWSSSGTGWPMSINESEIRTNLPASEEAFELGIMEKTPALAEALTPEGASNISTLGGLVLSASLYGHNFEHIHRDGTDENPHDVSNGEFWKRHRKMDNVLSNTFMFLPDHLRLPAGIRNMSIVFIHMNLHTSTICLHQAAIVTAQKHNVTDSILRQSEARCLMAAEEITNTMRLVCHVDVSTMNCWVGFCLYVAAGVFLNDQRFGKPKPQNIVNIEFLLAAMWAIGFKHTVIRYFSAQLELEIEAAGLKAAGNSGGPIRVPSTPMDGVAGISSERDGVHVRFCASGSNTSDSTTNAGMTSMCEESSSAAGSPKNAQPFWTLKDPVMAGVIIKPAEQQKASVNVEASPSMGNSKSPPTPLPHRMASTPAQANLTGMDLWDERNPFTTPGVRVPTANNFGLAEGVESFLQNNGWDNGPSSVP
ncbi:uncharacterized protein RAG0_03541 [Rhynchosporium agropyri]|uniref:Zn(2)-C6 fungal-type domain-containing protein n=1 Tax=Rhynchosporium agropyri TaxID=914238 RepID=A0A1E1K500_9HELO|nr:uncharacterized protein RAG0_03541 [Rhynchosporium agropyri]